MLGDIHPFNPDFSIILGDFHARWNNWWVGDTQTSKGCQIDSLTTAYGFRQLISEPTHILKNSSCIDVLFTDQLSLILDSGTHPSLHPNCHHKIMVKLTEKSFTPQGCYQKSMLKITENHF